MSRVQRWENATSIIMVVLSVLWLVLASWYVVENADAASRTWLRVALVAIWFVFLVDYLVRLALAEMKRAFVRRTLLDLGSVLVPIMRPFHLLSYLKRLDFFKAGSGASFRTLVVTYASIAAVLFVYTISLGVLEAERGAPNANILTLGDSLWWAAATVSTVGYGDVYPVTTQGRLLAVTLMAGGVGIVGIATATVVSWLAENIRSRAQTHGHGHTAAHDSAHSAESTPANKPVKQPAKQPASSPASKSAGGARSK